MGSVICIWLHHLCSHMSQNVESSSRSWNRHSIDLTHLAGWCVYLQLPVFTILIPLNSRGHLFCVSDPQPTNICSSDSDFSLYSIMALCNLSNILTFYVSLFFRFACRAKYWSSFIIAPWSASNDTPSSLRVDNLTQIIVALSPRRFVHVRQQVRGAVPWNCSFWSVTFFSISVTMMSRLMLNLHETADLGIYSTQATSTHVDYVTQYVDTLDITHSQVFENTSQSRR